ncbi:MAG: alanyl-tRNA synthetase [Candidatus Saccharibacteria bacterium]|nr:alanyl-tRNA synthetase [Candidatus Saccharibacteria bacterium]
MMNAQDIRNKYLKFMEAQGHVVIPRALVVPQNDPSTLFTGSGMQPLIPYLLGEKHQNGTRLVDSQTCLRAQDIDEVGDNRHTTFFEMLGNWSLGDYFKKEQLRWFFEFLVGEVGLDPERLYVTCCSGFPEFNVPKDEESAELWTDLFKEQGVDAKKIDIGSEENGYQVGEQGGRIFFYDKKNWWNRGTAGPGTTAIGDPCGPDSEVFYLFDQPHDTKWGPKCHPNCDCGRFMEIGNSVFMEYLRTDKGFEKLPAKNVDFGGGLERIAAAQINSSDVFKISILWPIIEALEKLSGKNYDSHTESMRVIADHLRAATFLAVDGITPSNKEQGYVMRRLVRRAIRKAFDLGIEQNFLEEIVPVITNLYKDDYPEVDAGVQKVVEVLAREEKVFRQTLRSGQKLLERMHKDEKALTGIDLFRLYDTYGYPKELALEEAQILGMKTHSIENLMMVFDQEMQKQREMSQTAAKGTFKGGLGGQTEMHKKYHTATHLMYQALRQVLGDHVVQNGSNITEERLRFDFSHPEKVTPEQIAEVEKIVNEQIGKDLKVSFAEYPTKVAREEMGALGQFGDRYGETVKVYKMIADGAEKPFSFEICGGPHVDHTLQLYEDGKKFKIIKEEASSAGIRRIKAVLV